MYVDSTLDAVYVQMDSMMAKMSKDLEVSESEQAIFDDYYQSMNELMKEEVSWQKLEPGIVTIYSNQFTEEELGAMIDFYKTEHGKSILKKMPTVTTESMIMTQSLMQQVLPKVQKLTTKLKKDLETHRGSWSEAVRFVIWNNALYLVDNLDILETHAVFHAMIDVFQV